jgi:RNA polymerase sigma factor (sigma-70 family)
MHVGLLEDLSHSRFVERLGTRLTRLAWFRFRIRQTEAEDIVQTALAAYCQVHGRYSSDIDHRAILVGIFRKKCLEHIDRSAREQRRFVRYCANQDAARENPWIRPDLPGQTPSVLEELVRADEKRQILDALAQLRPASRRLIELMVERNMGRRDLIDHLRLNKNTLDSRLHVCRLELRRLLARRQIVA